MLAYPSCCAAQQKRFPLQDGYTLKLEVFEKTNRECFGLLPGVPADMATPQAVILRKAITVYDPNGVPLDWKDSVEPHFVLLQKVAAAAHRMEAVFSGVTWADESRHQGAVFESVQEPGGRCQTVITHSSSGDHFSFAAESIVSQVAKPVAPSLRASGQATETGEVNPDSYHAKFDRLDEKLVELALREGVPPWILSLLNTCVGTVVEQLCECQLLSMKGSLMYFDPKGKDVVLPQPAHIDYDPDLLYFGPPPPPPTASGACRTSSRNKAQPAPRMLPASVFIFSFSNHYNLFWWKDFCGPNVLKKIATVSPFGEDGPFARSALDWMSDPAFKSTHLQFGDILWMDGSMVHAGAPFGSLFRKPVFRLHVFACARNQSTADSLGTGVDSESYFVQLPGSLSNLSPPQLLPFKIQKAMKKT